MQQQKIEHIIISRTDNIGDVVLTLPMCYWIKNNLKGVKISFLAKDYVKEIIERYTLIDSFISYDSLQNADKYQIRQMLDCDAIIHVFPNRFVARCSREFKIPMRVGSSHRFIHLWTCNFRVGFSRKKSNLHESQLNFNLLKPLGLTQIPEMNYINSTTSSFQKISNFQLIKNWDYSNTIILHAKSKGSAIEWPIDKFITLAEELVKVDFKVIFTGTEEEGFRFRHQIPKNPNIIDTTGKLSLGELIDLISKSRALVACSTGPYHIAGLTGIKAIGLFSNRRPIFPKRWRAIGTNTHYLLNDEHCKNCKSGVDCKCVQEIEVHRVIQAIQND